MEEKWLVTHNDETVIRPTTFQIFNKNQRGLKKNLIINATRKLIKEKSLNNISIRDIVKEVGIAPASLYSYFKSRELLFIEIFIVDLINIDMLLKKNLNGRIRDSKTHVTNNLCSAIKYIMDSEAFIQMFSILLTEKDLPVYVSEKIGCLKANISDSLIKMMRMIGIRNPDDATANAFLSSVLGAAVICWNSANQALIADTVSVKEIVEKIIRVFDKTAHTNPVTS